MKDFLYISRKYKIRVHVKDDSRYCFGLTADLFTGHTFSFYHHQVPSTSSRLAIIDLLFLRSMSKLWVYTWWGPFLCTIFFSK